MPNKKLNQIIIGSILVAVHGISSSQTLKSCDSYPYRASESLIELKEDGKFKIISTGSSVIDFDDPTEVMNARREAELIAKRTIAEYIAQKFNSEESVTSEVNKTKSISKDINGFQESAIQLSDIRKQISNMASRSNVMLRGVIALDSCYSKGKEVRVTVGIASESMITATKIAEE